MIELNSLSDKIKAFLCEGLSIFFQNEKVNACFTTC